MPFIERKKNIHFLNFNVWKKTQNFTETLCPEEFDPPNGTVLQENLSVNGIIQYACNEGFNISAGNLNRTCFPNGTWSGNPPTCSGKKLLTTVSDMDVYPHSCHFRRNGYC